jgi:acyl phosphate:glycerol-3-phosphate acyltransferase
MLPVLETAPVILVLVAAASYLLGSIPFGLVITRLLGLGDLRAIGSGNIGATNVLRTGNKGAALATLLLDAGKGGIAVLIARFAVGEDAAQAAALFSFLGHLFPVWLGFRGGKGVATFLGTLLALAWPAGLLACATWLVVAGLTRISSLSALVAAASAPVWLILSGHAEAAALCILLAALVFVRHAENIARLRAGTEPRIGARKS